MAQLTRNIGQSANHYGYVEWKMTANVRHSAVIKWLEDGDLNGHIVGRDSNGDELRLLAVPEDVKDLDSLWVDVTVGEDGVTSYTLSIDADLQDALSMQKVRAERDRRLMACDYTQLADSPLSAEAKTAWAVYRQALRDLPGTITDVNSFDWPESP